MSFCIGAKQRIGLYYDSAEPEAVRIAIRNLEKDLKKVFPGAEVVKEKEYGIPVIIVTTLTGETGTVPGIDQALITDEKGALRKEAFQIKVQEGKLYITGTDRRGTIYGIYALCERIGISPWYFLGDVPVRERAELLLEEGYCQTDWPSVEYRGIFINDEEELDAWARNYMGEDTIGVKTYEKIFELLLRLGANYIWPAMHVNSFNQNPENGDLAERMGIVVGTSHCDMLMRSNNREWLPWITKKGYPDAVYDYSFEGRNREILKEYWRESAEQNKNHEVCYTLGMRGIHDSGFETKNLTGKTEKELQNAKVALLEKIIADQREILRNTLGHGTMMTFIPYKEVMQLYDNGLNVPDDMTLVWANDNYGHIRRYPSEKEKKRKGGNGIYYHNSYWAPPGMSYTFLCSIPLAHTRNELQKAWDEGIRKLWVLNCGSVKPLEQEITFFLKLAWEIGKPGALTEDVEAFVREWIDHTFSGNIGRQVSVLLNDFSQITNVRKVENMDYDVFSQTAYGDEAGMRIRRYEELFIQGNALYEKLPEEEKDSFFQLVLMRIHGAYFTNLSYYYGDRSTLMYERGCSQAAALYTKKCREAEDARRRLIYYYNHVLSGGKWNGMLDPEGFPPPRAAMMPACTPPLRVEGSPHMRVDVWNESREICFATPGEKWIEIGNRGTGRFQVRIQALEWVEICREEIKVCTEKRVSVRVNDVSQDREGQITVESVLDGYVWSVPVSVKVPEPAEMDWAVEEDGLVALEAAPLTGDFRKIARLGRMKGDLVESCVQREPEEINGSGAKPLCYHFITFGEGEALLEIHRFPSLNAPGRIRLGVSLDDGPVEIAESYSNDEWKGNWKDNVFNNVDRLYMKISVKTSGKHCLSVWAVDRYFAFSRLILYTKPRKENSLAGIRGAQPLPREWDMIRWCDGFYGSCSLPPRPVFYASHENRKDSIVPTFQIVQEEAYGETVETEWYREQGKCIMTETDGDIRIDAAAVLAQSGFAWVESEEIPWQHCASECFGRSGLSMYIRSHGMKWQPFDAPSLNYRIECTGGCYTLWMLCRFNMLEEGVLSVAIDGDKIPEERLYGGGRLWRYEAEQINCWVPAACVELEKGAHILSVQALSSGMRYDRFYLTKGWEQPPVDSKWLRGPETSNTGDGKGEQPQVSKNVRSI